MQDSLNQQKSSGDNITPSKTLSGPERARRLAPDVQPGNKRFDQQREESDKKAKEAESFFDEYLKNQGDDSREFNDLFEGRGAKQETEREFWNNYENTVTGMNELIGYKPVSWEKYEAQFRKEGTQKGWSEEKIKEELQKIKGNPHATWT